MNEAGAHAPPPPISEENMPQDIKSAAGAVMSNPALTGIMSLGALSLCALLADIRVVQGESSLPNLSGTYRCVPDTRPCQSATFTVSQSDGKLDVKGDQGDVGTGELGSNISVTLGPPWNALGTILSDQRTIEWASGTRWQKQ
jgi:hypothetical protein